MVSPENETVRFATRFRRELLEFFPEVYVEFRFGRNIQNDISGVRIRISNFFFYGQRRSLDNTVRDGFPRSGSFESEGPYDHLCTFEDSAQICLWKLIPPSHPFGFPSAEIRYIRVPRHGSVAGYFIDANREGLRLSAFQEIRLGELLSRE